MMRGDIVSFMTLRNQRPIDAMKINDGYIIAIYRGNKGKNDIIIRYRQKLKNGRWSRIRTPRHIHWVVDFLMKLSAEKETSLQFLKLLEEVWREIEPVKSRENLKIEDLFDISTDELIKFEKLSKLGEYDIKFLFLLTKLLMLQEKTNYPTGKITEKIISQLMEGEDIFSILHTASFRGR